MKNILAEATVTEEFSKDFGIYDLNQFFLMSDLVANDYAPNLPKLSSTSLASGVSGSFSGYAPLVESLSRELSLNPYELWLAIGQRKLVAGQESQLREIALELKERH